MAKRNLLDLLRRPLVVAPMGGGPSTVELVRAAGDAGALGFLAAGYKTSAAMLDEVAAVRAASAQPFGVNVFAPGVASADVDAIAGYLDSLRTDAEALDTTLGEATWDDDGFDEKISALLVDPPSIVSFTFGCPSAEVITAFQDAGSVVAVTVTGADEALIAEAAGADALCVQGYEAGAHRGCFASDTPLGQDRGLLSLIAEVARVTDLPQIAAGGIMGPDQLHSVLRAGAVAAQCGTAFLRCPESGAHPLHKAALVDPRYSTTAHTRSFSGRWARGLVNRFMIDHADAPAAYPELNSATRPLRAAAAMSGDTERMSLWAGRGYRSASDREAGEIVEWLCASTRPGRA